MRAALFWRWLTENRPETKIVVFTHSKLFKFDEKILLLGPGLKEVPNGVPMIVRIK